VPCLGGITQVQPHGLARAGEAEHPIRNLDILQGGAREAAADLAAQDQLIPLQQGAHLARGVVHFRVDVCFLTHSMTPVDRARVTTGLQDRIRMCRA
jgi:hypothetical protein